MDEEIRKKLEKIEKRLSVLEGLSKKENLLLQENLWKLLWIFFSFP